MKRELIIKNLFCAAVALGIFWGYAEPAAAGKDIEVLPSNTTQELRLNISSYAVRVGENVSFDFSSTRSGYVSLWDIGTSGKVSRIFPNRYGGNGYVDAGQTYSAGTNNQSFCFRAGSPAGMEDVYLVWTETPDKQPQEFKYDSAKGLSKDLAIVERQDRNTWATAKITFEIIKPGGGQGGIRVPSSVTVNTNVYILAMGANVRPLTKTNQDAQNFAKIMGQFFEVPGSHIRLARNVTKKEFQEGMAWLRQSAGPTDLVLIFFSGHGSTIKDDDGDEKDGFDEGFVTYDAQTAAYPSARHMVRDDEFASLVKNLPTQKVITFIDACHSGGLRKDFSGSRTKFFVGGDLGKEKSSPTRKDIAGGFQREEQLPGLVYAAAKEDQAALETAEGGLFIITFLKELAQHGNRSSFNRIFGTVKRQVLKKSRNQQTPVAVGNSNLGEQF